jgi:hemin uptake protein HemP
MDSSGQPDETTKKEGKVRWNSSDLLKGQAEVLIFHEGDEYRLRLTKNHKLILTK